MVTAWRPSEVYVLGAGAGEGDEDADAVARDADAVGEQVYVEGRLSSRQYQIQSGETRTSLDVSVTDIQFLGQRPSGEGDAIAVGAEAGHYAPADDVDDLPF